MDKIYQHSIPKGTRVTSITNDARSTICIYPDEDGRLLTMVTKKFDADDNVISTITETTPEELIQFQNEYKNKNTKVKKSQTKVVKNKNPNVSKTSKDDINKVQESTSMEISNKAKEKAMLHLKDIIKTMEKEMLYIGELWKLNNPDETEESETLKEAETYIDSMRNLLMHTRSNELYSKENYYAHIRDLKRMRAILQANYADQSRELGEKQLNLLKEVMRCVSSKNTNLDESSDSDIDSYHDSTSMENDAHVKSHDVEGGLFGVKKAISKKSLDPLIASLNNLVEMFKVDLDFWKKMRTCEKMVGTHIDSMQAPGIEDKISKAIKKVQKLSRFIEKIDIDKFSLFVENKLSIDEISNLFGYTTASDRNERIKKAHQILENVCKNFMRELL